MCHGKHFDQSTNLCSTPLLSGLPGQFWLLFPPILVYTVSKITMSSLFFVCSSLQKRQEMLFQERWSKLGMLSEKAFLPS